MYFEHNFMNIDAVMVMPDSNSIEMSREKNLTSDNSIKLKCSFTVETYYPAFRRDRVTGKGYPREYGSGMKDSNGFALTGGISNYFEQPTGHNSVGGGSGINAGSGVGGASVGAGSGPNTGGRTPAWIDGPYNPNNPNIPYGATGSFYNTGQSSNSSDIYGTFADPAYGVFPKRTRWFNNILRSRERAGGSSVDPVLGQQDIKPRDNQ